MLKSLGTWAKRNWLSTVSQIQARIAVPSSRLSH